ncbi:MAG: DNA polymerase A family protein [Thermoguttaceae bacterium]
MICKYDLTSEDIKDVPRLAVAERRHHDCTANQGDNRVCSSRNLGAVELQHDLPFAPSYDDVRALLALLQLPPPPALTRPGDPSTAPYDRVAELLRLAPQLLQRIDSEGLGPVYREIELPVAIPTVVMFNTGLRVNQQVLRDIQGSQYSRMEVARRTLRREAGRDFNPDDAAAVRRFLYQDLGLPCPLETRHGNQAVSKAALAQLHPLHPLVAQLQTYRDAKSAYDSASAVLAAVDPATSIVRGNLDPLGTLTGRYSCSDPPLQALDKRVRRAIEAAPGCVLLEADYSQMELRVLAHFSQDAALLQAFQRDEDLHRRTAARVLGIAETDVTDQQRQLGKTLNFGIVYGQTAYGLADELGVPLQRAEVLLAAHAATYPGVAAWVAEVHQQAANMGEVRTLYGRRRYLPNIYSAFAGDVAEARRHAVNTVVQGTAADLLKMALIRLNDRLPEAVRMLLSVHDSVLIEARAERIEEAGRIVREAMDAMPAGFTVALKTDIKIGRTWAECK